MKRYKIVDKYRFWEVILIILIIGVILFSHVYGMSSGKNIDDSKDTKNNKYKIQNSKYILTEQDEFLKDWNGLPRELNEWMDVVDEEFVELDVPLSRDLQLYVFKMCKEYDMDFVFVMAVIQTESSFKVDAKCKNQNNNYYSLGLCQLNEKYVDEFKMLTDNKDFDINSPYDNIEGGIAKLAQLKKQWSQYDISEESMWLAVLNSYNKGYTLYKSEVISRGGFFSRSYDKKVLKNKEKIEGGM